jgi:steroid delta-isomerase-like uncharacterized protein
MSNGSTKSREAGRALLQRLVDAARRHDVASLARLYGEDAVATSPVLGDMRGRDAIARSWERLFQTFPDMAVEVTNVLVDGDRVAALASVTATDETGWFGLPPTGGPIAYRLVLLLTIRAGKIVHDERIYDSAGVVERLEKARLDKEMRTAAEVQRALLSTTASVVRFSESVGDSLPCRAIGGDFFEFIDLPTGDVGLALGDVSGKGPPAALLAAMLQGMLVAEAHAPGGPSVTLSRINRSLVARGLGSRFATLIYGVLSADGRLVYANAGHPPPVLLGRDGVRRLVTGGLPVGLFADASLEEATLRLQDQDTLVMFTDGATESRDARDQEFGESRLMACLQAHASSPPPVLLKRILDAVREFCEHRDPTDDITVTVTRFLAAG